MKRIILQHWEGELTEIVRLSSANIANYADAVGSDYSFISGYPLSERLTAPCQKVHMLAEEWDEYDVVVMLDADMFARSGLTESIFDEAGIGWNHADAHRRVMSRLPRLTSATAPFWGGAVYRIPRAVRQRLRSEFDIEEAVQFNSRADSEDEGIMHRLAMRSGMTATGRYLGYRWSCSSFETDETTAFIHMRNTLRDRPGHPANGRDKLANYHHLCSRGIVE